MVTSTEVGPGNLLVCTGVTFLFWCSSLISLGPSFLLPGPIFRLLFPLWSFWELRLPALSQKVTVSFSYHGTMSISSCPPPSCLILLAAIRQLFLPRAGDRVERADGQDSWLFGQWQQQEDGIVGTLESIFMPKHILYAKLQCGSADAWEASPAHPSSCLWLHSWLLFSINREKKGWLKTFGGGLVWDWVVVFVCPILSQRSFIQEGCWPVVTAIICKVPLLSAFYAFHRPTYRGGCRPDLCTQREKKLCAKIMAYIDQRHTPESWNYKTVRGKQRKSLMTLAVAMVSQYDTKGTGNKRENRNIELHQNKKFLCVKRHN